MKQLSLAQLAALSREAQAAPRKRMNHNLHSELTDPIQRLAIAMEPDTYIRPHHHGQTWELLAALRGRFVVLNFDADGAVIERTVLGTEAAVIETPAACAHAVLSLDPGGVILEIKHGPYVPFTEDDFEAWSPSADSEARLSLLAWYQSAAVGQRWRG